MSPSNRGRKTNTIHRKVLSSSPVFCSAKYRGGVTEETEGLHFIENLFDCFFNLLPERPECICRQAHSSLKYMSTPRIFLLNLKRTVKLRSCFKFIPRQIEPYVEADWSLRYAVNSGLLTKIKGFKMRDRSSIWPEHTYLK